MRVALLVAVVMVAKLASAGVPYCPHMYKVTTGTETEIRLRPIDMDGNAMTATITTLPSSGLLYQLAHNYDQYGYEPKIDSTTPMKGPAANTVTGSNYRVVYRSPAKPVVESFYYTATDSEGVCKTGKVTMLGSDLKIVGSDFAFDVDGWTVHNNLGNVSPTHEASTQGKMSWYVTGTEHDINTAAAGNFDDNLWYFNAPAKFLGHHALAYGGTLRFSLAAFSGFQGVGGAPATANPGRYLVKLHCSVCNDRRGVTLGWPIADTAYLKTADFDAAVSLPLLFNSGWLKDPQNSNLQWSAPSQSEMVEVMSNLSYLRILGDFTNYYESVGLDDVQLVAGASSQPIPYTSREKAEMTSLA